MRFYHTSVLAIMFGFIFLSANAIAQNSFNDYFYGPQGELPDQATEIDDCFQRTISVSAFVVTDSLGNPGPDQASIEAALDIVNTNFEPTCMSFKLCDYTEIPDFKFDTLDALTPNEIGRTQEDALTSRYYKPNTINIYFVYRIEQPAGPVYPYGYTYMPGGKDVIVMSESMLSSNKALTHLMGHFFGLKNTFRENDGDPLELVDGSNCETEGDGICDTPADPYTPGAVLVNGCNYVGTSRDSNDQLFIPDVGNFMSHYPEACACRFTAEQYRVMVRNFVTKRKNLW